MPKISSEELVLTGSTDWEQWIWMIKQQAQAGDVWELIDPQGDHEPLEKPTQPVATPTCEEESADTLQLQSENSFVPGPALTAALASYKIDLKEY